MLSEGTVRVWSDDHGWGVIDSADTPSAAYRSSLTIRWQDGSVTKGLPGRGQDS